MNLSPRDRRIAMIGGIAVVAILVYYFGIDPAVGKWSQLNKDIAKQEKLLDEVAQGRRVRGQAADLRERIGREVSSYAAAEEFNAHMPRMITQLTERETYPGVTRLDTMPLEVMETHAKCGLSLSFECGVDQLAQLLYDLQRAEPLLVVDNLRITTNEKAPSLLRVRMAVCSFAMLEEEGAG